jgi:hypothetical protein
MNHVRNPKRYFLVNQLIKQYEKLHDASEKALRNLDVSNAENLQARGSWLLSIGRKLLDRFQLEDMDEKVQFT